MSNPLSDAFAVLTWPDIGYTLQPSAFVILGCMSLFEGLGHPSNTPTTIFLKTGGIVMSCLIIVAPFATVFSLSDNFYENGKIRIYEITRTRGCIPEQMHAVGFLVSLPLSALFMYFSWPLIVNQVKLRQMAREKRQQETKS